MPDLDDFLNDIDDDDDAGKAAENDASKEVEALREEIAALKKESYGRLQETKNERQKRQNLQGRLDTLTDTVNNIIQQRQAGNTDVDANVPGVIGVDESESGELFIQEDKLKSITAPLEKRIEELQQMLEVTTAQNEQHNEAQEVINAIVGEEDSYGSAYNKYKSARKWVNDQVIEFQNANGITHSITSGQALDNVFDADLEKAFNERYPNLDLEKIVTAEDSKRHFRNTLKSIADATKTPDLNDSKSDDKFRQVLQKPSGLAANKNAKGAELNVSEKLEGVNPDDIYSMSDAQVRALEKALLQEEQSGGVSF